MDPEQCDVGPRIGADHLGPVFASVGQPDHDLVGVPDDMLVGDA